MSAPEHGWMRLDRAVTLSVDCAFRHRPALSPRPLLPVLMYHSISSDTDANRHPYYRTVTTPETFAAHMKLLGLAGYRGVSLRDAARFAAEARGAGDPRLVVLTFDDGFADFRTNAFPLLAERGYTATVFPASAYIDGSFLDGRRCLASADIAALTRDGIEFGSHTVTHPQLHDVEDETMRRELFESRAQIESITGQTVRSFSYPFRFPEEDRPFVVRLKATLHQAGYEMGVTTTIGTARAAADDDRLFMRRLPINDLDDPPLFMAKLRGAYDWLHVVQAAVKRMRRITAFAGGGTSRRFGRPA